MDQHNDFDKQNRRPEHIVDGADYSYNCGCYWFSGNVVACRKHSPHAAVATPPHGPTLQEVYRFIEENDRDYPQMRNAMSRVIQQCDDLLSALKLVESVYRLNCVAHGEPSSVLDAMQAAIAKAEGR